MDVYVEAGRRRVFAGALAWPGWCRGGKTEEAALDALKEYRARYAQAIGKRVGAASFTVVERLPGDATTDFGAPGIPPAYDARDVTDAELRKLVTILRACWSAFDEAARAAAGVELTKGPRGGGRDVDKMIAHVLGADCAYARALGLKIGEEAGMARMRDEFEEALFARAHGEPVSRPRGGKVWSPRYAIRRSAWHALDHAWEIEDRTPR